MSLDLKARQCQTPSALGELVIDFIAEQSSFLVDSVEGETAEEYLIIWSANAQEQIGHLLLDMCDQIALVRDQIKENDDAEGTTPQAGEEGPSEGTDR